MSQETIKLTNVLNVLICNIHDISKWVKDTKCPIKSMPIKAKNDKIKYDTFAGPATL